MTFALVVIKLHVLYRRELRNCCNGIPLRALVRDREADLGGENVWFAVLSRISAFGVFL